MRISPRYTSTDWKQITFEKNEHWHLAVDIFKDRIRERFLDPIDRIEKCQYAGFAVLALDCLLIEMLQQFRPEALALEELYSHYKRPRTAILMGHARGVICLAAAEAGIPVVHYAATQVKNILTGSGRASKSQMQSAIQRELALPEVPEPPDVADALAIALCHYYLKDKPSLLRK